MSSSAIIRACLVQNLIKNTGKECDKMIGTAKMIIPVPQSFEFTDNDLLDPVTFFTAAIHAARALRIFPLFGNKAPIKEIKNSPSNDIIITLDDQSQVLLGYGFFNWEYATLSGGLCYAQALQSFNQSGYSNLIIDGDGNMLCRINENGNYAGILTDFMFAPSPDMPDIKTTTFKNRFRISVSPQEVVQNGVVLANARPLLSMMGLIDAKIVKFAAATTTKLKFNVLTECKGENLIVTQGDDLGTHVDNFIVTDVADDSIVIPSAAAIVGTHCELTGVFTSGHTYKVIGSAPSIWLANDVEGYDASENGDATFLVP